MDEKIRVLIVDDEKEICEIVCQHLVRKGYEVIYATSAKEALPLLKEFNPQVMLLDKRMPDIDGIEFLKLARQINKEVRVIFVSGDTLDDNTQAQINSLDVFGYLCKPAMVRTLDAMIEEAVKVLSPANHTQMLWQANG